MFCIYVFSDKNFLPVYVGKAKNFDRRIKQHLGRDRFRYDTWFYRWLNKQIREDNQFFIDILEETDLEHWKEREIYWIRHIKSNGYLLTNMTDGGDGNNNQVFSKESIEKRRLKLIGRHRSAETIEKISRAHKGKIVSEETKRKLSEINTGKPCPASTKLNFSKPVNQYSLSGNFIQSFISLTEASTFLKCRKSSLSNAIKRNSKQSYKGYKWKYENKKA